MRYIWFIFLSLFFLLPIQAQQSELVKQLEKDRKKALLEIATTNKLLNQTNSDTKNSLNRLNLLSNRVKARKKIIVLLNNELQVNTRQRTIVLREIRKAEKELELKRKRYANSIRKIYQRNQSQNKLLYILSANSFAQSMRRLRFLKEYADWQKTKAQEIIKQQKELELKHDKLEETRKEKQKLLSQREKEYQTLAQEKKKEQQEVKKLQQEKKKLQRILAKKKKEAEMLNKKIEALILAEIKESEKANKRSGGEARKAVIRNGYAMTKKELALSNNFVENRGKLPYPVNKNYTIVGRFGTQQHSELKYVKTQNDGIDLQTTPGADACAVFNGVVTRVFIVPGFNNSVIIRHGNYLTVYSNLSKVYVKRGDKVSTKEPVGQIFSDAADGNSTVLHFQLWKEKTKQNPQSWLGR